LNDQCDGAENLGSFNDGQSLHVEGSTIGATNDSIESPRCGADTQREVWYRLSIAFPAEVTVDACQDFQVQVAVYSGTCGSLICQANIDDITDCQQTVRIIADAIPFDVYVRVGGLDGTTDMFYMTVSVSAIPTVSRLCGVAWQK